MLGKLLRWLIDREGKGGIWESDPELCTYLLDAENVAFLVYAI